MDAQKRILVNTIAQYAKSIINICLSLYSTRLILDALSISDYGIYSVVAGVVGILGYLTNSLVVTTQRYLSFYHGARDSIMVKKFFFNSMMIHLVISLILCLILLPFGYFFTEQFLNIDSQRVSAAYYVYNITVAMLITTLISTPFKALLVAYENIVYISLVEICDGVLKLCLALVLALVGFDKLVFYSMSMLIIISLNFLAFFAYCRNNYEECHGLMSKKMFDMKCVKQVTGFAGWTTFGMLAGVSQMQGMAIILNKVFGTVMNASFGVASQVNGAIRFVSTSVLNAMNPQIMKAEGIGNRGYMLELAGKESKFSTALMVIISMPLIFEMPDILAFWLMEVPEKTPMFCRALMIAFIIDQFTIGLHAANQAIGLISTYTITTTVPKILLLPILCLVIYWDCEVDVLMMAYIAIEAIVAIYRIPYMKYFAGLHIMSYFREVLLPLAPLIVVCSLTCYGVVSFFSFSYRFILCACLSIIVGVWAMWQFTLSLSERCYIKELVRKNYENRIG